jgi:hypothetical protein
LVYRSASSQLSLLESLLQQSSTPSGGNSRGCEMGGCTTCHRQGRGIS